MGLHPHAYTDEASTYTHIRAWGMGKVWLLAWLGHTACQAMPGFHTGCTFNLRPGPVCVQRSLQGLLRLQGAVHDELLITQAQAVLTEAYT
jgi:hypothetical protein